MEGQDDWLVEKVVIGTEASVHRSGSVRFLTPKWATSNRNWSRLTPNIVGLQLDRLRLVLAVHGPQKDRF
jgi:hypothetical protein